MQDSTIWDSINPVLGAKKKKKRGNNAPGIIQEKIGGGIIKSAPGWTRGSVAAPVTNFFAPKKI